MTRRLAPVVLLAALWCSALPAAATPAEAEAHYARGVGLFKDEKYVEAATAFAAAYEADKLPKYVYNLAQAERLAGDCERASTHYKSFIDSSPPEDQRQRAQDNLASCEETLAKATPIPPPVVHTLTKEDLQRIPGTTGDPLRPLNAERHTEIQEAPPPMADPAGGVLLASGLAVLAAGAAVLGYSYVAEANAEDLEAQAESYEEHRLGLERAGILRVAGAVGMGAGAALGAGALARYLVVANTPLRVTAFVTPDDAAIGLRWKF